MIVVDEICIAKHRKDNQELNTAEPGGLGLYHIPYFKTIGDFFFHLHQQDINTLPQVKT